MVLLFQQSEWWFCNKLKCDQVFFISLPKTLNKINHTKGRFAGNYLKIVLLIILKYICSMMCFLNLFIPKLLKTPELVLLILHSCSICSVYVWEKNYQILHNFCLKNSNLPFVKKTLTLISLNSLKIQERCLCKMQWWKLQQWIKWNNCFYARRVKCYLLTRKIRKQLCNIRHKRNMPCVNE